MDSHAPCMTDL